LDISQSHPLRQFMLRVRKTMLHAPQERVDVNVERQKRASPTARAVPTPFLRSSCRRLSQQLQENITRKASTPDSLGAKYLPKYPLFPRLYSGPQDKDTLIGSFRSRCHASIPARETFQLHNALSVKPIVVSAQTAQPIPSEQMFNTLN
jgi:hypothetical protein